ncbi:hydrolase [Thermincola ferriacetica]|uniref:Hydrolase n=1 Tax=Thermincola ferriacetica TaxID=281456 RepID=A0A0L6VZA1_9FIRM|nr:alpha/beta hydrolase [Thermincola ferriacetica]KNZ68600.1 hydrolase [Thermincola ferriacetica]
MRNVSFLNSRGQRLAGVLHQPDDWLGGPTIVICHGFRGSKEGSGKAAVFSEEAVARGYRVLRFDFAGTGDSEGDFANITLTGYMDDLASAIDYLSRESKGPFIALGRSFGGTTAICRAALDKRIAGVCTWGSPHDLEKLFIEPLDTYYGPLGVDEDKVYHIETETDSYELKAGFFIDLKRYNVLKNVQSVAPRPVLIIHGSEDCTVPMEQGIKLFENARYPKELAIIAGADHRFTRNFRYVFDTTLKWLEKYFPAGSAR